MKSAKYGAAALLMAVVLVGLPSISSAQTVGNPSIADLQAQIAALLVQIQQLQAQLAAAQGGTTAWCHTFNANVGVGSSGSEVAALQTALQKSGFTTTDPDGTYGESTAAAVTGFQEQYRGQVLTPVGLSNGTGYAGPSTRAELNALYGCSSTTLSPSAPPHSSNATSSNATTPAERDAERLSGLREAQNALELYYNKYGYYPGTCTAQSACEPWEPTTGYDNGASSMASVIESAGLGVTGMPDDPTPGNYYYYATYSGGTGYILAARLEGANNSVFSSYVPPDTSGVVYGNPPPTCHAPFYCVELGSAPSASSTSSLPDLTFTNLSVSTYSPVVNQSMTVAFDLVNNGNGVANPATWSGTSQADGISTLVASESTCTGSTILQPGQSCRSTYEFTFPTTGTKTLTFVANQQRQIQESNYDNNSLSVAIDVVGAVSPSTTVPYVDLKINGSSVPISVNAGSQLNLTWTSAGVSNCYAGNNWSGAQAVSGGTILTAPSPSVTTGYLYSLNCRDSAGLLITAGVQVNVFPPSIQQAAVTIQKNPGVLEPIYVNAGDAKLLASFIVSTQHDVLLRSIALQFSLNSNGSNLGLSNLLGNINDGQNVANFSFDTQAPADGGLANATPIGQYVIRAGRPATVSILATVAKNSGNAVYNSPISLAVFLGTDQSTGQSVYWAGPVPGQNVSVSGGTIGAGTLAVALDPSTPAAGSVVQGAEDVPFTVADLTAGPDADVSISQISVFSQSDPDNDLTNLSLWNGSTLLAENAGSGTSGPRTNAFSSLNLTIPKGTTKVLTIKASIAPNATVGDARRFQIYGGSQYIVTPNQNVAINGSAAGNIMTISAGTPVAGLTVTKNAGFEDLTAAPNSANVEIGSYAFKASSESGVQVNAVSIKAAANGSGTNDIQNMKIMVGSAQFGATQGIVADGGTYTFSGTPFTVPAGGTVYVNVYADIASGATTADLSPATSLAACTGASTVGYSAVACPSGTVTGQDVSISAGGKLTVALDGSSPAGTVDVMGSTGNVLAAYRFTETSNSEAVKITDLQVLDYTSPSVNKASYANLQLFNGSTLVGTASAAQTASNGYTYAFHFTNPVMVPQGGTTVLTLRGDVMSYASSGATDNSVHIFQLDQVTALGASSNMSIAPQWQQTSGYNWPSGNPMLVLRTRVTASASQLGPSSARAKTTADDIGNITLAANSAGSAAVTSLTVTFGGTAPASADFLGGVQLIDASGQDVTTSGSAGSVASAPCTGSNTCTKTWNFSSGGWVINAGSSYTFKLRVDDTKTAPANANLSQSLTATILSNTDVKYSDGLDASAHPYIALQTSEVPLPIAAVSFMQGTYAPSSLEQMANMLNSMKSILSQMAQML